MSRRVTAAIPLFLLAAWPATAQDLDNKKQWPVVLRSAHYEIRSTCTREQAQKLIDHMEIVFTTYTKLFGLARPPNRRLIIVLFRDEKEYEAHGDTPPGSAAYYDRRHLVGYYDERRMYNYFAHEGMHQFTDVALKDIERAPAWFSEGMADCIGNSEVRGGRLFMCVRNGVIAQENLPVIREMVRKRAHVPLKKFLTMPYDEFMARDGMYPQAWSLCHFLLTAPGYEDPKSQIPNGKYWTVLSTLIRLMSKRGTKVEDAIKASFQLKGKPIDLDALEKEWADWVLKMENDGTKEP